ncbi:GMP reductase [Endozoicomonas atrinae]|uniref:GMP reductase n=1 Tax=Endozoicomonas atrinae TaxID=1333660 RepID=UPI003B00D976
MTMRVEADIKLGFKDVLFRPKRSTLKSRSQVSLERTFRFVHTNQEWTGVPVIAANMDTVGTFAMALALAEHKMLTAVHKHYTVEEWKSFLDNAPEGIENHIMVSSGTSDNDFDKMSEILSQNEKLRFICIDVANGYSEHFVEYVSRVRQRHPNKVIIAGNVVTGEMVEELILKGADIVKVGIGPGSVCTTRVKTGVGYPQLSAVIECADAAHGVGGQVISDGGCTCAGDVSKAFGGGADFVMIGGMFAGHDESGGEMVEEDGKQFRLFYGMSSTTAMDQHAGGVANYRASEGKTVKVPYRGPIVETVQDILGGVRSTCTYVGAAQLKELSKRTTFIRVQEQENRIFN